MFQKAIDSLIDSIKNALIEAITAVFFFIGNILEWSFKMDGKDGTYAQFSSGGMIKATPFDFSGGTIWSDVKGVSDNVIVPIAILVLLVVLVNDLIQQMV